MKQIIQPIPCCNQLALLSHEHFDIMLFVWKIKQGMKLQIEAERIAQYCDWFWEHYLQEHFEKEETELQGILSAEHPMITKILDDHDAIEIKLRELVSFPSYPGFHRLAQIISYHIGYEEAQVFPVIEKVATDKQLYELTSHLMKTKKRHPVWTDEFWNRKK